MKATTIITIVVVALTSTSGCLAAPSLHETDTLKRPSPINPAIPMDPKPAETVTVITDPKEIAKIKREIGTENIEHAITAPTTIRPLEKPTEENHQNSDDYNHIQVIKRDPAKHRQKRTQPDNISTQPLIYRDQLKLPAEHKQISEAGISATPQALPSPIPPPAHQTHVEALPTHHENGQHSPVYFDAGKRSQMKRDIPVPLVPKYQHPEESPEEEPKHDDKQKNSDSKNEHASTTSASTISTSTTKSTTTTHH